MATSHKSKVEEDYNSWVQNRSHLHQMENFQFLTHCTKPDNKESILETNTLRKHPTPDKWKEPLAKDNAPHGVWFGVTLKNGEFPSISPFGTKRVLKSVASLLMDWDSCNLVLYLEAIKFRKNRTNVRLILLEGNDEETIAWCEEERLHKLDIHYNPFLTINIVDNQWICKTLRNEPGMVTPDTWVALFIADDVDVAGCEWDTVELYKYCSNYKQSGHGNPECPRTECRKCGGYGHWASNCPNRTICGGYGHAALNCPNNVCFKCGLYGHAALNCPNNVCLRCGLYGHAALNCPNNVCFRCGGLYGHLACNCPNYVCLKCGGYGHSDLNCPNVYLADDSPSQIDIGTILIPTLSCRQNFRSLIARKLEKYHTNSNFC